MLSYVENRENIYESRYKKDHDHTNFAFLVLSILLILITILLFGYCGIFGHHDRFERVLDDCKNFCGKLNDDNPYDCGPKDLKKFPYLHIEYELLDLDNLTIKPLKKCVETCPRNFTAIQNKCKDTNKTEDDEDFVDSKIFEIQLTTVFSKNLAIVLKNASTFRDSIATMCLFALFFSYIFVILFRFIACYVIWVISIGFVVCTLVTGIVVMEIWSSEIGMAILAAGIILCGCLTWFRRKIRLVAKIIKESSGIMVDMPVIVLAPVLTFTTFIVALKVFIAIAMIIHNSGEIHRKMSSNGTISIQFVELPACVVAHVFNIMTFVWFTQFILSCQHFMVTGIISKWYFIRDKEKLELEKPIKSTFSDLIEFHIGSVCFGSMTISAMKILRVFLRPFRSTDSESKDIFGTSSPCFMLRPLQFIVKILHYPSRSAYVVVAKDGVPFLQAGKRVFHLESRNVMDIMILNDFGAVVFFICRILVVLVAGTFGYEILELSTPKTSSRIPLIIGAVLAYYVAHCFMSFYEMLIDSLFICFCIDCEENDGAISPYYMPDSLKKMMIEIKEATGGRLTFSDKNDGGIADGSDIPMLTTRYSRSQ